MSAMVPLDAITASTQRMLATAAALSVEELAEPSLLPGWTKAHVVAHLALNAEGLAGVLRGTAARSPRPMYASVEGRDEDIARLVTQPAADLLPRLRDACTELAAAVDALPDAAWSGSFERTPGGPRFDLENLLFMRWYEVEIHHADLGSTYTRAQWPDAFSVAVIESRARRNAVDERVELFATDLRRAWHLGGPGGRLVSGTAADLGWWLTGRGDGIGLTVSEGELPEITGT